ncbi:MAG: hypothetical protein JNK23_04670 [Opitutaceae bacterium]|nr:hypothetical protein [Opitutaceae bacterium]
MPALTRYQKLLNRRARPDRLIALNARVAELQESEDIKYLLGAMEPLDADYTEKCLGEAERVQKYLEPFASIRLQGSVTTNTHIRYHSDVDILTITEQFTAWEGGGPAHLPTYAPDPVVTLMDLRARSRRTLAAEFPEVTIREKDRALSLSGGSLRRNVDVVTANWYHSTEYVRSSDENVRGVQVLSTESRSRVLNLPFLHQHRLREKDALTGGGSGRAIRLLKTLKADAESDIAISSYDICALVWNMEAGALPGDEDHALRLAGNCASFLLDLVTNEARLNALTVPNGLRRIVGPEGTSLTAVRALWHELYRLLENIRRDGKEIERRYLNHGQRLLAY